MRLELYIIYSTLLIIIVSIFIFTINNQYLVYTIEKLEEDIIINLPIAIWVIIPTIILMIMSVIHILFYGTKINFKVKRLEKDIETLEDSIYWSLLEEPRKYTFKSKRLKEIILVLSAFKLKIDHFNSLSIQKKSSEKIKKILYLLQDIESGQYVDLKNYKLKNNLSKDNAILVKNLLNLLDKDINFIEDVLEHKDRYNIKVFKKALSLFATQTDFNKVKKYINVFDIENFMILLKRTIINNKLYFTKDILMQFILKFNVTLKCSHFMLIAEITKEQFPPTENLKIFKILEGKYVAAQTSYLYLLFDYEMVDKAQEYLSEYDSNDFIRFRALYDLKKDYKKYRITDLMRVHQICNDS